MNLEFLKNIGLSDLSFLKSFGLKKAFTVVVKHLEDNACGHPVKKFEAYIDILQKSVKYLVWFPGPVWPEKYSGRPGVCPPGTHLYIQDNGEKYADIITGLIKDQIPSNAALHKVVVNYSEEQIDFYLFVEVDGEKKTLVQKIKQ